MPSVLGTEPALSQTLILMLVKTRPKRTKRVMSDGNCLFRTLLYILTGSENYHAEIWNLVVAHLYEMPRSMLDIIIGTTESSESYLASSNMMHDTVWGQHTLQVLEIQIRDKPHPPITLVMNIIKHHEYH